MKPFPSIPSSWGQRFVDLGNAYVLDKLDGRNTRVEWSKKRGWHKYGSRHRLFDHTDPEYAGMIPLFSQTLAEPLAKIATDNRWESVIAFMEYWSTNSLGGVLVPGEEMHLTLIGFNPYKKGLMGPAEFRRAFEGRVPTPNFLGQHHWTRDFVRRVREGGVPGITFEGVVGSVGDGHQLQYAKAKTQAWVDAILARYGEERGTEMINS